MQKKIIIFCIVASIFVCSNVICNNAIWSNHFGGNPNSSNVIESDYNLVNARLDWEYKLPDKEFCYITTTNSEIVCLANDPELDTPGTLYSFDMIDGKLKWKMKQLNRICIATNGDSIIAGGSNQIICYDSSNGNLLWNFQIHDVQVARGDRRYDIYHMLINGETAYFSSFDGYTYSFDLVEKKINWSVKKMPFGIFDYEGKLVLNFLKECIILDDNTGNILSNFMLDEFPDKNASVGNNKFIYWEDDILYCHDLTDGKLLWKNNYSKPDKYYISSTYSVTETGYVLVGASFDYKPLICLDAGTGKELWSAGERRFDSGLCSYPTIVNDKIYLAHDYGFMSIYDLKDGKELFNKELYDAIQESEYLPVVGNRIIFNHRGDYDKKELVLQCYRNIASKLTFTIDSNKLVYDNETKTIDSTPKIINGVTFVPAKYLVETLGGSVELKNSILYITNTREWKEAKILECKLNSNILEFTINHNRTLLNDNFVQIDPKNPKIMPIIINGRTMVPLRFLAESLGCKVEWNADTKEITVSNKL